jgi:hypothetical protein
MKRTVVIAVCLLLFAASVPLFAHGRGRGSPERGRFSIDNPNRWNGSPNHPAFHGWRGWGQAPCRAPDGIPAEDPKVDPGDKPAEEPGEKPADKAQTGGEQPIEKLMMLLDLTKGSVIG